MGSRIGLAAAMVALTLMAAPQQAAAVFSGEMSERAEPSDSAYAAALRAKKDGRWEDMKSHLMNVIARRPWHDNAHTLMGYAYRRLGDYERSLAHYRFALDRNPRHRGAMEYMGVTLLHLGALDDAKALRKKLWDICGNMAVTFTDGAFGTGCDEWEMLDTVIIHYEETGEVLQCR